MKDRFDLEQEIAEIDSFADRIDDLYSAFADGTIDEDDVLNGLIGISVLLKIHSNKLYETMCDSFDLNKT